MSRFVITKGAHRRNNYQIIDTVERRLVEYNNGDVMEFTSESAARKEAANMNRAIKGYRKNPVKKYFQLYDVANDYSLSPVKGKYQFGDLAHAKKAAQDDIDKWVEGMDNRAAPLSAYKIKWGRSATSGTRPESKMEWNGSIHDGELVYKIIERRKNPVKKNPERITQAWLDKRVGLLNDMLGLPQTQYTRTASGMTGNRGHLFIDHAYGGVKVGQMSGGGTGESNISDGYVSKRELNNFINGMIAAVRLQENKKRNPSHRKKATKKRAKKNPTKQYLGFKIKGKDVRYLVNRSGKYGFSLTKGDAIIYDTKAKAHKAISAASRAVSDAWDIGVAPRGTDAHMIWLALNKGKA